MRWSAFSLAIAAVSSVAPIAAAAPQCVYRDEANPENSFIWFERSTLDGEAFVHQFNGEKHVYGDRIGSGGTGIMTVGYRDSDGKIASVLVIDLSEIAKPGAPQSVIAYDGNAFWPDKGCR